MILAIHRLARQAGLDSTAVDTFMRSHQFPLIEGMQVTFVWRGAADAVHLRHWVFGMASAQKFHRLAHTDLWHLTIDLPRGSRFEYKFDVTRGSHSQWIRDPLNPNIAHDPFGANSVCQGEGYEVPDWCMADPDARHCSLHELMLNNTAFGGPRPLTVYLPARYRETRRYPLLIVHDGGDYLRYARLKTVLDNLIHRLEVAPMIVALTHPKNRMDEYPNDPHHAEYIVEQVLPFMERNYPVFGTPAQRCLMGASFGGNTRPVSSEWVMMSAPMRRVDVPQLVAQAYSSLPSRPWNCTSKALPKFCPRKCEVPACRAFLSCIIASMQ